MGLNYKHLPNWLENNWLFRKLFLLRKLFLIKKTFTHHGQWAEDLVLERQFFKSYKGFYVDVGCFHPVKYNNTYKLYRKGWRGVNIDIDSIKIEGFNIVRPRDTNVTAAISDREGELTYWSNGFYSLTITLDESFAKNKPGYLPKKVKASTLTTILDTSPYRDRRIDLLTVDAEGHDLQVLQSLDWDRYAPKVIAVESFAPDLKALQQTPLYQWLEAKEYQFSNWIGLTSVWRAPDYEGPAHA